MTALLLGTGLVNRSVSASGPTAVSGPIFADTTWSAGNSPYVIASSIVVEPGFTLTVQPGATVQFASGGSLDVEGTLLATGTITQTVTFTNEDPYSIGSGTIILDTTNSGSSLSYATVSGLQGLVIYGGSPTIDHTQFIANAAGVLLSPTVPSVVATITNSRFIGNCWGIRIKLPYSYSTGWTTGDRLQATGNLIARAAPVSTPTQPICNATSGIEIDKPTGGIVELEDNTVQNNPIGIKAADGTLDQATIQYNSLHDNMTDNLSWSLSQNLGADSNWWGTTDPNAIYNTISVTNGYTVTIQPVLSAKPAAAPSLFTVGLPWIANGLGPSSALSRSGKTRVGSQW